MKHFPLPGLCIMQCISLAFLALMVIPFAKTLEWPILALPIVIIIFVWLCDLAVFVFSLTVGWNAPLQISNYGIAKKGGTICFWSEATGFFCKKTPPILRPGMFDRVIIYFSNGTTIIFEPYKRLMKDILSKCPDEDFIKKLNDCVGKIYHKR